MDNTTSGLVSSGWTGSVRRWVGHGLLAFLLGATLAQNASARLAEIACLAQDRSFSQGADVYDPTEGIGHRKLGSLAGPAKTGSTPAWGISQWNTRAPFAGQPAPDEADARHVKYVRGSKQVTFGAPGTKYADVALRLNTAEEYDNRLRARGQRWPALYLWQSFDGIEPISELSAVKFKMDVKLNRLVDLAPSSARGAKENAAQFTVFLTVQNTNKASPDFGKYVWFGLPVFDNRYLMSPKHEQTDAFTKKFIYLMAYRSFAKRPVTEGAWVHLEADLLDEINTALRSAAARGFFVAPMSLRDFYIRGMNVGWEMPGSFDGEIQFKELSVCLN